MADDAASVSLQREIERLNARITQLSGENARRKGTVRELCAALGVTSGAELQDAVNALRSAGGLAKLRGEVETLRTKANPTELQAKYDQAVTELRTIKHREGLKGLYADKDLGLNPDVPVERLEAILGLKPEGDAFDAGKAKAAVGELKTKGTDPYLFGPGRGDDGGGQTQPPAPAWGGRGVSGVQSGVRELTVAQLRDPTFMLNPERLAPAGK